MTGRPLNILFVCTGNSCRSPMAEGLAKKIAEERGLHVDVRSAGTHAREEWRATPDAVEVCREVGVDISGHQAQRLTPELVDWADHVLVMEEMHSWAVQACDWRAPYKVWKLAEFVGKKRIDDPIGKSARHYRKCRDLLTKAVDGALERLVV